MARVIIVGAGLSGLTAAFRLSELAHVTLVEASSQLGGQIATTQEHGFVIERGAEGFVFRSEAVPKLAADLGMPDELIAQSTLQSYGFDGQALRPLAPGEAATFLGFQVPREDLGKGIRSFRRGMGSLIAALVGNVQDKIELRLSAPARRVAPCTSGAQVELADGQVLRGDLVIVAVPARAASKLLEDHFGEPARALAQAPTLSSVTVELSFDRSAIEHPLDGTGFVVAEAAQRDGLRACTFTSSKFALRAPHGKVSLRLFFRPSEADLALSDGEWAARAHAGLMRVLPLRSAPEHCWVSRWPDALPVFNAVHRASVSELEHSLEQSRIRLAGAAFHGSGIDAAVRSGETAAQVGAGLLRSTDA